MPGRGGSIHLTEEASAHEDPKPKVRAEVISTLLRGGRLDWPVHHTGLHVCHAGVEGQLSLRGSTIDVPWSLTGVFFEVPPDLDYSRHVYLALIKCVAPGFAAREMDVRGTIFIEKTTILGNTRFAGSRIGGNLQLLETKIVGSGGRALDCSGATVGGAVALSGGFVKGGGDFRAIEVGGDLDLSGATFDQEEADRSLSCIAARVGGNLYLDKGFKAVGNVDVSYADIGLTLDLHAAELDGQGKHALEANQARVGTSIFIDDSSKLVGGVGLGGVTVGGGVFMANCTIGADDEGIALRIGSASVAGSIVIGPGVSIAGAVEASHIEVEGNVTFTDVSVTSARPYSVNCSGARVGVDLQVTGIKSKSRPRLAQVRVRGRVRSSWTNPWHRLWYLLSGYGYQPWRVVIPAAVMVAVGALLLFRGEMVAVDSSSPTQLHRWLFSIDALLPFVDLGQSKSWTPATSVGRAWLPVFTVMGWFFGIAFGVSAASLFRRR